MGTVDDFGLDACEIFTERHRAGSMIVTSNRGRDDWLGTFADPVHAQSAIDRFTRSSWDFVIEGESYRPNQTEKARAGAAAKGRPPARSPPLRRHVDPGGV